MLAVILQWRSDIAFVFFFLARWKDGTNQLMGEVWNWNNMYGTTLKKFDGLVLHTNEQDGNGGEDDAAALPEDHEGGPEDGYGAPTRQMAT